MAFPKSPNNGDLHTENGKTFYAIGGKWKEDGPNDHTVQYHTHTSAQRHDVFLPTGRVATSYIRLRCAYMLNKDNAIWFGIGAPNRGDWWGFSGLQSYGMVRWGGGGVLVSNWTAKAFGFTGIAIASNEHNWTARADKPSYFEVSMTRGQNTDILFHFRTHTVTDTGFHEIQGEGICPLSESSGQSVSGIRSLGVFSEANDAFRSVTMTLDWT